MKALVTHSAKGEIIVYQRIRDLLPYSAECYRNPDLGENPPRCEETAWLPLTFSDRGCYITVPLLHAKVGF